MTEFDPSKNENLDEGREVSAARIGNDLLGRYGLNDRVFYDESAGLFYLQDSSGEWRGRKEKVFSNYLKRCGVNAVREDDSKMSDLDLLLLHIYIECTVGYAGAIAGHKRGLILNNGQRVLVTREAAVLDPVRGDHPTITCLIDQMFGLGPDEKPNDGDDQRPYFLGWWKHALECLDAKYEDHRGLCMVFAGEAGCGKSLLKDLISISLGGRECKPYRFMIGQDNFNGEFIGSELWVVDDEQASTRARDRSEFSANIKKAVADRYYRIRGMMRDGVVLDMYRRMLVCVNREPERLQVLPQLDDDIQDKISVLLTHKHPMPLPVGSPEEKSEFWNTLKKELPAFVWMLRNEHSIDPSLYGRFGVTHYHHPDLCSDLFEVSRDREFWIQVMRVLKKSVFPSEDFCGSCWYWCGGATALYELMSSEDSPLTRNEINSLYSSNSIGKSLKKISKQFPDRCIQKKVDGCQRWFVSCDGRDVLDAVEAERGQARASKGQAAGEETDS